MKSFPNVNISSRSLFGIYIHLHVCVGWLPFLLKCEFMWITLRAWQESRMSWVRWDEKFILHLAMTMSNRSITIRSHNIISFLISEKISSIHIYGERLGIAESFFFSFSIDGMVKGKQKKNAHAQMQFVGCYFFLEKRFRWKSSHHIERKFFFLSFSCGWHTCYYEHSDSYCLLAC